MDDDPTGICAECGAEVTDATERPYVLSDDRVLCFACAAARGGAYDDASERWVVAPDLSHLGAPEHQPFTREPI